MDSATRPKKPEMMIRKTEKEHFGRGKETLGGRTIPWWNHQNPGVNLLRNPVNQDLSVLEFLLETFAVVGGSLGHIIRGIAARHANGRRRREACGREIWMALARLFHRGSMVEKHCNNMAARENF